MNYRWALMGISTVVAGMYLNFLYKIPFAWLVSVAGLGLCFFGYSIKRHDWYADHREIGAGKQ